MHDTVRTRAITISLLTAATACVAALAALFVLASPRQALAYVDPSVMTYTIQALAGVAVALGAVAGVALRRTRKALFKLFKIDEDGKKTRELDVARCEPGEAPTEPNLLERNRKAKNERIGFFGRLGVAAIVAVFAVLTVYTLPAIELIAANSADLVFGFSSLWPPVVCVSLIAVGILTVVLAILPSTVFRFAAALVTAVGLCVYVQAMFLNGGLPAADGTPVDWWGSYSALMIGSLAVWVAIIAAGIIFTAKARRLSTRVATALCLVLVVVQGVGLASIFADSANPDQQTTGGASSRTDTRIYVTEEGLWNVAASNNTIVFVLDCFDTRLFEQVSQSNASLFEGFEGFVWYKNSSGMMLPTSFAVPYLLTGSQPTESTVTTSYFRNRYLNSTFLPTLKNAGISTGLYSDGLMMDYLSRTEKLAFFTGNTDNIKTLDSVTIDEEKTVACLFECTLYRNVPWVFKSEFRYYTDELNQNMADSSSVTADGRTPYITDDAKYLQNLQATGLEIDDGYSGAFRFIHLNGTHEPYCLSKTGKRVSNSTAAESAEGSLYIVKQYLAELKRLGVYEDATIIVTADHGSWTASDELPTEVSSPILLYKPSATSEGTLTTSTAQVSHADFFDTVLASFGIADASTTYTGLTFAQAPLANRTRTTFRDHSSDGGTIDGLYTYTINGDVLDFSSWTYTGEYKKVTGYSGAND